MAVIHRALFTWILLALLFILLALKLDGRSEWNWLLVLIPMWILDAYVLITLIIEWIQESRRRHSSSPFAKRLNSMFYCLVCVVSKLAFQLLLCVRLEYAKHMPTYVLMTPLWTFLVTSSVYFVCNFFIRRDLKLFF